jgi:phenylpropionate dioxygenase-like ring-hydroxylating dioxygenase large terminal subunit
MADRLVDLQTGAVSRAIYSDEEIYQLEIERIFARCWLCIGHETLVPEPGDYLTTYMGEDPVIVWRDGAGRVHGFLNTCRHRGNRVCLFDRGNASSFTCSYHGWSYDSEGKLVGVPFHNEAYYGELDRSGLGLIEVPKLAVYGGMIFASWDAGADPLGAYLGEMRWYLDHVVRVSEDLGGFDVLATSRYATEGNWKIPAENFAGDHYHNATTHGSSYALGLRRAEFAGPQLPSGPFEVALQPGHGLGGLVTGSEPYERDLANAERIGPEAVDYIRERYERLTARQRGTRSLAYSFSHANVFPSCALWGGSALRGNGIFSFHPRGPLATEVRQLVLIPRAAPPSVREAAYAEMGRGGHFASGLFEQDDANNFAQVTENTRTYIARQYPFHFGMGLRQEGEWPGQEQWDVQDLPGLIGPRFSEHPQRRFYAYWAELIGERS